MAVYDTIKMSFKKLLNSTPLEKMTVADICKLSGISRKTFYAYFLDKNDVIEKIIYDDIIHRLKNLRRLLPPSSKPSGLLIMEGLYQSIYDDQDFYRKILTCAGPQFFQEILSKHFKAINVEILSSYVLSDTEKKYMAYYFASAYAALIIKWIKDKMVVPPTEMAGYSYKWGMLAWENSLQQLRSI